MARYLLILGVGFWLSEIGDTRAHSDLGFEFFDGFGQRLIEIDFQIVGAREDVTVFVDPRIHHNHVSAWAHPLAE